MSDPARMQALAAELRSAQAHAAALERDAAARGGQLSGQAEQLAMVQQAHAEAQAAASKAELDAQVRVFGDFT